jgi:hypothetical protein
MQRLNRPRTRQQQLELRSKGKITGYFTLPRGRPPKDKVPVSIPAEVEAPSSLLSDLSSLTAAGAVAVIGTEASVQPVTRGKRGPYKRWSSPSKQQFIEKSLGVAKQRSISGAFGALAFRVHR